MKRCGLLALFCALPVHGEIHQLDIEPEIQRHSALCWAAVSVMATRAFPTTPDYRPATQEEVVLYQLAQIPKLPSQGVAEDPEIQAHRTSCGIDFANCDSPGQPFLLGLKSRLGAEFDPDADAELMPRLGPGHFRIDIAERGVPIIIKWTYQQTQSIQRSGGHFLIVTGYDDENHDILVYDPWPESKPDGTTHEPAGHLRYKWISQQRYAHPQNDNGNPVKPVHAHDQFAIHLASRGFAQQYPQPIPVEAPGITARPIPQDISRGAPDAREAIATVLGRLEVRMPDGRRIPGPYTAAAPFPVVVLTSVQVDGARKKPRDMFQPRTTTLVVPVLKDERIVDSFLLLNQGGQWVEGGYSNNEIARLLHQVRRQRKNRQRSEAGFYLVSIPEEGSFYAAHGFRSRTQLISLAGGARQEFAPARQALRGLADKIDRRRVSGADRGIHPR